MEPEEAGLIVGCSATVKGEALGAFSHDDAVEMVEPKAVAKYLRQDWNYTGVGQQVSKGLGTSLQAFSR